MNGFTIENGVLTDYKGTDTEIIVPDGVHTIDRSAFENRDRIISVELPSGVRVISDLAFRLCKNLKSVRLSEGITHIGSMAFCLCESLQSITLPDTVTVIGSYAFNLCRSLRTVHIPAGVEKIESNPFTLCHSLQSITVDSGNPYYSSRGGHLYNKNGTELIAYAEASDSIIPEGVISIAREAFRGNSRMSSLRLPESLTEIGEYAFSDCVALQRIDIHRNISIINGQAFSDCIMLKEISVDKDNPAYSSADGILYSKNGDTLISYATGKTDLSFRIPDGVTRIGSSAFELCPYITHVTIPDSVTAIGYSAFGFCPSLESVEMSKNIQIIESNAFYFCSNLDNIRLPDTSESLAASAFRGCRLLKEIYPSEKILPLISNLETGAMYASVRGYLLGEDHRPLTDREEEELGKYMLALSDIVTDLPMNNTVAAIRFLTESRLLDLQAAGTLLNRCTEPECKVLLLNYLNANSSATLEKYGL